MPKRAHFLLLLTPGALNRCGDPDDWVRREFLLAVEHHRNIVPVREESVDLDALRATCPDSMQALFDYQTASLQHRSFDNDLQTLTTRFIPRHKAPSENAQSQPGSASPGLPRHELNNLDRHAPERLIGREAELDLLDKAWAGSAGVSPAAGETPALPVHILSFVAMGGEGKTSLVSKWAADLIGDETNGCAAAFAWSFYSQGSSEQSNASADWFLREALVFFGDVALVFFGDVALADSPRPAAEKGKRLAELVGGRRALLVLDGLEPLQHPPASPLKGQLKDPGLSALLKHLALRNQGLCLVTTRYCIQDLNKASYQTTAPQIELKRLSSAAGVELLKRLGVKAASRNWKNWWKTCAATPSR